MIIDRRYFTLFIVPLYYVKDGLRISQVVIFVTSMLANCVGTVLGNQCGQRTGGTLQFLCVLSYSEILQQSSHICIVGVCSTCKYILRLLFRFVSCFQATEVFIVLQRCVYQQSWNGKAAATGRVLHAEAGTGTGLCWCYQAWTVSDNGSACQCKSQMLCLGAYSAPV